MEWHNLYDDPAQLARQEAMTRDLLSHLARAWARFPASEQVGEG